MRDISYRASSSSENLQHLSGIHNIIGHYVGDENKDTTQIVLIDANLYILPWVTNLLGKQHFERLKTLPKKILMNYARNRAKSSYTSTPKTIIALFVQGNADNSGEYLATSFIQKFYSDFGSMINSELNVLWMWFDLQLKYGALDLRSRLSRVFRNENPEEIDNKVQQFVDYAITRVKNDLVENGMNTLLLSEDKEVKSGKKQETSEVLKLNSIPHRIVAEVEIREMDEDSRAVSNVASPQTSPTSAPFTKKIAKRTSEIRKMLEAAKTNTEVSSALTIAWQFFREHKDHKLVQELYDVMQASMINKLNALLHNNVLNNDVLKKAVEEASRFTETEFTEGYKSAAILDKAAALQIVIRLKEAENTTGRWGRVAIREALHDAFPKKNIYPVIWEAMKVLMRKLLEKADTQEKMREALSEAVYFERNADAGYEEFAEEVNRARERFKRLPPGP